MDEPIVQSLELSDVQPLVIKSTNDLLKAIEDNDCVQLVFNTNTMNDDCSSSSSMSYETSSSSNSKSDIIDLSSETTTNKPRTSFAEDMGFVFVPATIQAKMPDVFIEKLGMPEVVVFTSTVDQINFVAYHEFTREQFLCAFKDIMHYIRSNKRFDANGKPENPRIVYDLSVYNDNAKIVISDKEFYYSFRNSVEENKSDANSDTDSEDVDDNNIYLIDIDDEEIYALATRDEFVLDESTFYGFEMLHKHNEYDFVPQAEEFKPDH